MSNVAITGNASGTGVFTVASPNSNVDRVLTLPDESGTVLTTTTILTPSATNTSITLGTAIATTSGTSIDFTGIPAGVKRVILTYIGLRGTGTSYFRMQIGSGTIATTGYDMVLVYSGQSAGYSSTAGFDQYRDTASWTRTGTLTLNRIGTTNQWNAKSLSSTSQLYINLGEGHKTLGGALSMLRLTWANGSDAFDAGSASISWEF